jgi:hypothetical protein
MISKSVSFKLFNYNDCWIFTKEKIASSWLVEQFNYNWNEISIDSETYEVSFKHIPEVVNETTTVELQQKFLDDWNSFRSGKNNTKNFIFLTRNPIHRFVSAWIQDFIMRKIYNLDEEANRLLNYFDKEIVDKFIEFSKEKTNIIGNKFPDVSSLPVEFGEIYDEFCFPRDFNFFKSSITTYVNTMNDTHTRENLFLLWEFVFNTPFNTNNKLYIIDIDLEKLQDTLKNKFNIPLREEVVFDNNRNNYLKSKSYGYLSRNHDLLNPFLFSHLLLWFDIVHKIYLKDTLMCGQCGQPTYDYKTLQILSNYKKKYYIPHHLDVFDIKTHINWWKYNAEHVSLTYT